MIRAVVRTLKYFYIFDSCLKDGAAMTSISRIKKELINFCKHCKISTSQLRYELPEDRALALADEFVIASISTPQNHVRWEAKEIMGRRAILWGTPLEPSFNTIS